MYSRMIAAITAVGKKDSQGRLVRGVLANVYDKGAVTFVQLLSIPFLVNTWGTEGYGIWLMLLTVPTYIALSDLGFGTAAGVVMTQCISRGDHRSALNVFQSTIAFVMGAVLLAALFAIGFAGWYYFYGQPVASFSAAEIAISVVFITGYAVLMSQMSIVTMMYRATHKFAFAITFSGTWILVEGCVLVLLSLAGFGLWQVAFAYLIIRFLGYLIFVVILRRMEPWVEFGVRHADRRLIKELASPSAAALGLTFATAIILQGMTLALGAMASPAVVAVFGASRTLTRAPLQLSGIFLRPSIVELTRAIVEKNRQLERKLTRINLAVALISTVPFGLALIVFGQPLLVFLSGKGLHATTILFVLLSLAATLNAIWTALSAPLIAMNRQGEFSYIYLLLSALSVALLVTLPFKNEATAAGLMVLVEAAVLVVVVIRSSERFNPRE